jgi:hypothetical protein
MVIRPVGADLFHADGQTDVTNLIESLFAISLKRLTQFTYELSSFPFFPVLLAPCNKILLYFPIK